MTMLKSFLKPQTYLKIAARLLHPLLRRWEEKYFRDHANKGSNFQPIFIVGSPRTGSTVLYQILTNNDKFLYIDNLASPFHRSMFFGIMLSRLVFGDRPHNQFKSKFGNTKSLHAPSECQSFWFRWFSRDHDYSDDRSLSRETLDDLRKTLHSIMNHHGKPLLFKNLACSQRISALHRAFPGAKFIYLRRDLTFSVQSLLLARRELDIADDRWWSVKPKNFHEFRDANIHEKLVRQVYYNERQIVSDFENLPQELRYTIDYEQLADELSGLWKFLEIDAPPDVDPENFAFQNKRKLGDEEFHQIEKIRDEIIRPASS